jgi:hypothetical protein
MRCDAGHEHESLDAALACVRRSTKATTQGRSKAPRISRASAGKSKRVSVTRALFPTRRGGRPRIHADEQAANRERQRRYRARRREQGT